MKNNKETSSFLLASVLAGLIGAFPAFTLIVFADNEPNPFSRITEDATVIFSEPNSYESGFIFTAVNNELFTVAITSIFLPDTSKTKTADTAARPEIIREDDSTITMRNFSMGNAFFGSIDGKKILYSAYHCTKEIRDYTKRIGADIAIIDYQKMIAAGKARYLKNLPCNIHSIGSDFQDKDSFFVKGYRHDDRTGKVKSILIKGIGTRVPKKDLPKFLRSLKNSEVLQKEMIIFKLKDQPDASAFPGLSGSPVFNTKNEVIGVYSGTTTIHYQNNAIINYGRVSLFN